MRSYAQYCPVAKASEILGDRWTLLIVREMLGGASGFNELQRGLPGISRSVLTERMRALERAEVIERRTAPKAAPSSTASRPPVATSSRSCRRSASGAQPGRSPSRAPRSSIPTC